MTILLVVIACGLLSVAYAIWATRSVLAADQGNSRMQEIAGYIREGAQAYLTRQYKTIAIVGVVVFIAAWLLLSGTAVASVAAADIWGRPLVFAQAEKAAPPAEAEPGGTRPTTPAPEPARPQAIPDATPNSPPKTTGSSPATAEVPPALPPAPAEKVAPPLNTK